jgi:hypothetical protein
MSGAPPAPALRADQQWLQDALRFPRRAAAEEAGRRLVPSPRLSGAEGLAVYQRGYFQRIASCMREQFPALCHALGEDLFNDFVADYIRERPPESHTLYDLGRRFPGWLDESRPDRKLAPDARELWADFMVDLARFERQLFAMFDAPGHEGEPLAGPSTPDRRLRLQPCFGLGAYRFPVPFYYHSVRLGQEALLPPARPSFVALVRTDYVTRTVPLEAPHYFFLKAMAEGGGVADGIAAAARHLAVDPGQVRSAWRAADGPRRRWLDLGFFIAAEGGGREHLSPSRATSGT